MPASRLAPEWQKTWAFVRTYPFAVECTAVQPVAFYGEVAGRKVGFARNRGLAYSSNRSSATPNLVFTRDFVVDMHRVS